MALKIQQNSIFQVGLIVLFWVASELVVKLAKLPVPGGVLGLGIVLSLLMTRRIRLDNIKRGTELLLGDMLLFFIPAVLAIIEHQELLSMLGLKILFIILSSTFFVMLVTAIVVDYCYHWRTKHVSLHTG
ncbi:CidA/LrgA family protein [Fluoribacter dumoffii]|uniref:CidA/LrgA family protein n=1 Tax=Fluoribacter dumoffii TaxID=463 RepID=UPI00026C7B5C|nr:CidA/LrgA family protein [Fluoribacter dumoffii]MCW8387698.1 CidA/LrgA family protein [Fluoribacter dumoffii]MCW8416743.1 CidA/LrgA family protein [Fluoribacter dumoffii]MCW8455417.1 CidA/LrgA family protein [Fluoribacter dumoffii]MCW8460505.1 CidA/LrgA family protein [Fluoribacter dumoffii]MCW8483986.1 CidA/LrgA family protein [Fluoribacter dumoffii]